MYTVQQAVQRHQALPFDFVGRLSTSGGRRSSKTGKTSIEPNLKNLVLGHFNLDFLLHIITCIGNKTIACGRDFFIRCIFCDSQLSMQDGTFLSQTTSLAFSFSLGIPRKFLEWIWYCCCCSQSRGIQRCRCCRDVKSDGGSEGNVRTSTGGGPESHGSHQERKHSTFIHFRAPLAIVTQNQVKQA